MILHHDKQHQLIGGLPTSSSEWEASALCAQTDPEAFFPEKGGSTRDAKKVCAVCPVKAECLEDALARDERFGVYGGLSERERRRLVVSRNGDAYQCVCGVRFRTQLGLDRHSRRSGCSRKQAAA